MPRQPRIPDIAEWPRCPQCGAPRTTQCPICETSGVDFHQVDPEYAAILEDDAPATAHSCGCDSGGCSSEVCGTEYEEGSSSVEPGEAATGVMVICPTCDEPFVPGHANRCEWCGHRFPDGYHVDVDTTEPEQFNGRVIGAMLGLGVVLLALAIYFAAVF